MAFVSEVTTRRMITRSPSPHCSDSEGDLSGYSGHGSPRPHSVQAPALSPRSAGIAVGGEFLGGIRCMQVHRTQHTAPGGPSTLVWTGEQDGALCCRSTLGQGIMTVDKKDKVYVTTLLCHGSEHYPSRFMYCGFSDGYIRVYEQVDLQDKKQRLPCFRCIQEVKKHSSSVTAMLAVKNFVVSGGRDRWIFAWHWLHGSPQIAGNFCVVRDSAGSPRSSGGAVGKLALHSNTVRCFAYDQHHNIQYSGGDDGIVYGVPWRGGDGFDSHRARALGGRRSRHHHRDGVRALVWYECYIFSASEDCTVKVWDILQEKAGVMQGGRHMKTICRSEAPIRCLFKDPAGGRVWAGGADGLIRVFNAHDFALVCELTQHSGSAVTGLHGIRRLDATKLFVAGGDGRCQVHYLESEGTEEVRDSREEEFCNQIERFRRQAIHNCVVLDRTKHDLSKARTKDAASWTTISATFGHSGHFGLKARYMGRVAHWYEQQQLSRRHAQLSELMLRNFSGALRHVFYLRWVEWLRRHKRDRVVRHVAQLIGKGFTSGLALAYLRKLQAYSLRWHNHHRRQKIAEALSATPVQRLLLPAYDRWRRWTVKRSHAELRKLLAESLLKTSDTGLKFAFWARLKEFTLREQKARGRQSVTSVFAASSASGLRQQTWHRLRSWSIISARRRRRHEVASVLLGSSADGLRRIYLRKAIGSLHLGEMRSLQGVYDGLGEEIAEQQELVKEDTMTDEEIDAEEAELRREIYRLRKEREEMRGRLEQEHEQMVLYKADTPLLTVDIEGTEGQDPGQSVQYILRKIGVHAINCKHDMRLLHDCAEQRKFISPFQLYCAGHGDLKEGIRRGLEGPEELPADRAEELLSQCPWDLPFGWETRLDMHNLHEKCVSGIQRMVIATHRLRNPAEYSPDAKGTSASERKRYRAWQEQMGLFSDSPGFVNEVVQNVRVLLEVVGRAQAIRHQREELERQRQVRLKEQGGNDPMAASTCSSPRMPLGSPRGGWDQSARDLSRASYRTASPQSPARASLVQSAEVSSRKNETPTGPAGAGQRGSSSARGRPLGGPAGSSNRRSTPSRATAGSRADGSGRAPAAPARAGSSPYRRTPSARGVREPVQRSASASRQSSAPRAQRPAQPAAAGGSGRDRSSPSKRRPPSRPRAAPAGRAPAAAAGSGRAQQRPQSHAAVPGLQMRSAAAPAPPQRMPSARSRETPVSARTAGSASRSGPGSAPTRQPVPAPGWRSSSSRVAPASAGARRVPDVRPAARADSATRTPRPRGAAR
eukprot:TRINITY_DN12047_c0_g2_i1.p1 TRINITY_DN12047_c0_g2~~TRINITY_DN12047_c0_g2_i1.p1  ORF type:complete len:1304 (+),score=359.41 TRINITY_DN12047_c0_g2_i1:85-3912(+)